MSNLEGYTKERILRKRTSARCQTAEALEGSGSGKRRLSDTLSWRAEKGRFIRSALIILLSIYAPVRFRKTWKTIGKESPLPWMLSETRGLKRLFGCPFREAGLAPSIFP
jgi:hypothetical protein